MISEGHGIRWSDAGKMPDGETTKVAQAQDSEKWESMFLSDCTRVIIISADWQHFSNQILSLSNNPSDLLNWILLQRIRSLIYSNHIQIRSFLYTRLSSTLKDHLISRLR